MTEDSLRYYFFFACHVEVDSPDPPISRLGPRSWNALEDTAVTVSLSLYNVNVAYLCAALVKVMIEPYEMA